MIWLNQSYLGGTVLTRLQQRAAANDPAWLALQSECDADVTYTVYPPSSTTNCYNPADDACISGDYGGTDYVNPLMALSLCYLVNGSSQYLQQADAILANMSQLDGAPDGTDRECAQDSCFGVKFFAPYMSIALDWLNTTLQPTTIQSVITGLTDPNNGWIASYPAYHNWASDSDPVSNYNVGYELAETLAAIALNNVGDTADAQAYANDVQNNLWPAFQQAWATRLVGGGWPEGWADYGPRAVLGASEMIWAASTGWNLDWAGQLPQSGTRAQARYQRYFAWPPLDHFEDNGVVAAPFTPSPTVASELATILDYTSDSTAPAALQFAVDLLSAVPDDRDPWQAFLFFDASRPVASYRNERPSYLASGEGHLAMRSSWSTAAANTVWATLYGGPYTDDEWQGEQRFDSGAFALVYGDQPIVVNPSGWLPQAGGDLNFVNNDAWGGSQPRILYNTFFTSSANPGQDGIAPPQAKTHINRYVDPGGYVRARAAYLEQQYVDPNDLSSPVRQFIRDLVYVRPSTFVIYDRTTVVDPSDTQWLSFYTATAPQPATPMVSSEARNDIVVNGAVVGSVCTVLPQNATITLGGGIDGTTVGSINVYSPTPGQENDWINVITQGDRVPNVQPIQSGTMTGVVVYAAPRNQVVLFTNDHRGQAETSSVTYAVAQTETASHVLVEMAGSSSGYGVTASASGGNVTVTVAPGGSCLLPSAGNLSFTVDTAGNVSRCSGVIY